MVNITTKIVFGTISKEPINNFPYFAHLSEKSYVRCITSLLPIVGNIIVVVYDTIDSFPTKLEDSALHPRSGSAFESRENPLDIIPSTSRILLEENILDSNSFEQEIDIAPSESKSESEEIDIIQQTIINNYKEFQNRKNQRATTATTNAVNPGVFIQPAGINNTSKNCWCISVLQILCNTPLYEYVMTSNLQDQFPKLFEFIKTYREKPESSDQLGSTIKEIRSEINKCLGKQFSPSENEEGDAMKFIMELFEYLRLDYYLTGYEETRNEQIKESISVLQQQCIFINPESIPKKNLDIDDIFDSTPYEPVAVLRAEPAHYSCQIKASDGSWYQCNDQKITKKLTFFQASSVEHDPSILIVGYRKNS